MAESSDFSWEPTCAYLAAPGLLYSSKVLPCAYGAVESVGDVGVACCRRFRRKRKSPSTTRAIRAARPIPAPIPAFAPVLRPLDVLSLSAPVPLASLLFEESEGRGVPEVIVVPEAPEEVNEGAADKELVKTGNCSFHKYCDR